MRNDTHIRKAITDCPFWRDYADPVVIEFLDSGYFTVVPAPHLGDVSWSDRGRPYVNHGSVTDLADYLGMDVDE